MSTLPLASDDRGAYEIFVRSSGWIGVLSVSAFMSTVWPGEAVADTPPVKVRVGPVRTATVGPATKQAGPRHKQTVERRTLRREAEFDPRTRGRFSALYLGISHVRIPSLVLSGFLRSFSNALCRPKPGPIARSMGVNRSDACNFGFQAGFRRVQGRRGFDLELSYTRLTMPKSNWVAANEDIPASDHIELSFHAVGLTAGMWRDIPLSRRPTRWSWRFGGQLGLAFLAGAMHRTKLGAQPASCTFESLGDLHLCRPYRPLEFNEPHRRERAFARCETSRGCDPHDLQRAGRQRVQEIPPVVPWINAWTGPGYAVDRTTWVGMRVGLGMGLTLGLSVQRRLGGAGASTP